MESIYTRSTTNEDIQAIVSLVKICLAEFDLEYSPESSEQDLQDIEATYTHTIMVAHF